MAWLGLVRVHQVSICKQNGADQTARQNCQGVCLFVVVGVMLAAGTCTASGATLWQPIQRQTCWVWWGLLLLQMLARACPVLLTVHQASARCQADQLARQNCQGVFLFVVDGVVLLAGTVGGAHFGSRHSRSPWIF
jgi:hypothetical protein